MRFTYQGLAGRCFCIFKRRIASAQSLTLVAVAMGLGQLAASGHDTRTVTEPAIPPACIILKAATVAPQGIAPQDEMWVDTPRIQAAIDHCHAGEAVELSSDGGANAFLSGSLRLRRGVTLLVDKDVTLYGSRNPRDYDVYRGSCGLVDDSKQKGCQALIVADHASHSGVMGEGVIDGRGGARLIINGAVQPESWWLLAEEARLWGHQQVPRLIDTDHTDDFTVYEVTLRNSPGVHLGFHNGNGMTVWGIKIDTPRNARNADGIDPSSAKNVTVAESFIRSGNDNVGIKAGRKPSRNLSILHNHFYWGHGMSIGSETHGGVSDVLVSDLSLDGPDNGLRIKSNPGRGGVVKDVTYEDVCIRGSKVPITLDSFYANSEAGRFRTPVYQDILLRNVRVSGGGKLELVGADSSHHIDARFDGVVLTDAHSNYKFVSKHADILQGPGPVNFQMLGEDSTLLGRLGGNTPLASCEAKFVPFPGESTVVQDASAAPPVREKRSKFESPEENPLGRLGYVASNEKPTGGGQGVDVPVATRGKAAPAAGTAKPVQLRKPAAGKPVQARCISGRCGTLLKHSVAQNRRVRAHCRRMHTCGAVHIHHRVRHHAESRQNHPRGVAARVAAGGQAFQSSQSELVVRSNSR